MNMGVQLMLIAGQAAPTAKTLRTRGDRIRSGRVWRWTPHEHSVLTMCLSEFMLSSRDVSARPSFKLLIFYFIYLLIIYFFNRSNT